MELREYPTEYSTLGSTEHRNYETNDAMLQKIFARRTLNRTAWGNFVSQVKYAWYYVLNPVNRGLILSVFFLVVSTTVERVSFKMGVDNMIPFRVFLAQAVVVHAAAKMVSAVVNAGSREPAVVRAMRRCFCL